MVINEWNNASIASSEQQGDAYSHKEVITKKKKHFFDDVVIIYTYISKYARIIKKFELVSNICIKKCNCKNINDIPILFIWAKRTVNIIQLTSSRN